MPLKHKHQRHRTHYHSKRYNTEFPILELRIIHRHYVCENNNKRYLQKLRRLKADRTYLYPTLCTGNVYSEKSCIKRKKIGGDKRNICYLCVLKEVIIKIAGGKHQKKTKSGRLELAHQIIISIVKFTQPPRIACRKHHQKSEYKQYHYKNKKRLVYLRKYKSESMFSFCLCHRLFKRNVTIIHYASVTFTSRTSYSQTNNLPTKSLYEKLSRIYQKPYRRRSPCHRYHSEYPYHGVISVTFFL